jgi:hypothetical protein
MRLWPLLALALLGCGQSEREVLVREVELGGLKLSVHRHEVRFKRPCRDEGLNFYRCLFNKAEKRGCVYLDIGDPPPKHAGDNPCATVPGKRNLLVTAPAEIDFEIDPEGQRFAWRSDKLWLQGYVFEHELLLPSVPYTPPPTTGRSTSAIDWRALKTLEDAVPSVYFVAVGDLQAALLKRYRAAGGDRAVAQLLIDRLESNALPGWDLAYQSLDETHRKQVRDAMMKSLMEDGIDDSLAWFDDHPNDAPKDFEAQLRERARDWVESGETDVSNRWLIRGYRLHDPAAPKVACQILERRELTNLWRDGEMQPPDQDSMPYAVIAATQSKCDAVSREFGNAACSTDLRCTRADAGTMVLCDGSDLKMLRDGLEAPDGMQQSAEFDNAAHMNALLAQGPLPKGFWLRDARRFYRQLFPPDAGVYGDVSPCGADPDRVSDLLCGLRPEVTHFRLSGCEVEIDDAKKTVRLWRPDEQDGGR